MIFVVCFVIFWLAFLRETTASRNLRRRVMLESYSACVVGIANVNNSVDRRKSG
jgi:hypothetical protein